MTLHGRVKDGVVVLHNGAALPDGTLVQVTPLSLSQDDVADPQPANAAGNRPASNLDPFVDTLPVSKERREALLGLIGIWKTEHPPSDEEVEQMIEEYRMKKYG